MDCAPHDVVLHEDGHLETPHDLEAERIGAAFGGYLSCLEVVDRVLPALFEWLALQRRDELPLLRRDKQRDWHLHRRLDCCGRGWRRAAEAAEHARSVPHLARWFETEERLLRPFTRALSDAFGWPDDGASLPPGRAAAAEARVADRGGVALLWKAGVAPEVIVRIHDALAGCRTRLPVEFYLGVTTRRPDLAWVLNSAAPAAPAEPVDPDPDTLTWLAWSETAHDRRHPSDRGDWLQLGVPRSVLLELSEQRYTPAEVRYLGTILGRTPAHAAGLLLGWTSAGLRPDVGRLGELSLASVPNLRLNGGALRRLLQDARSAGLELGDLEAAELLLVWGNVPEALACARAGRSDPLALARTLHRNAVA